MGYCFTACIHKAQTIHLCLCLAVLLVLQHVLLFMQLGIRNATRTAASIEAGSAYLSNCHAVTIRSHLD